jgi:hypothetical protein
VDMIKLLSAFALPHASVGKAALLAFCFAADSLRRPDHDDMQRVSNGGIQ